MFAFFCFFLPQRVWRGRSPFNGEIEVMKQFGRFSLRIAGIEQSGPLVEKIWEKALEEVKKLKNKKIKKCLILGLGGGSAVKLMRRYFPQAKIVGVEIDPLMVKLGKRYLDLKEENLEIQIADATDLNNIYYLSFFDLVLVDLYLQGVLSKKVKSSQFLLKLKEITPGGVVVFNCLRRGGREDKEELLKKLRKIFPEIKMVNPLVNQLLICSNESMPTS